MAVRHRVDLIPPRYTRVAQAVHRFRRLVDLLPLPLRLRRRGLVVLALLERRFPQQLPVVFQPVGVDCAALDSGPHGTARLAVVRAVREPASVRQRADVVERRIDGGLVRPRLQLAHPRRVDQQRAARQLHQLPRGGRMATLAVCVADRADTQRLAPEQAVDQRRLPDAGRSHQRDRLCGPKIRRERVEPLRLQGAHRDDVDERQPRTDRGRDALRILGQVGLVQEHDRHGAPVPDHREIPLEAPHVQVAGERGHEKDRVDVGGQHLLLRVAPHRRARQHAAAFEAAMDRRSADASRHGRQSRRRRRPNRPPRENRPRPPPRGEACRSLPPSPRHRPRCDTARAAPR